MNFNLWFREQFPAIQNTSIQAVLKLAEEGATIPFMARYRKEQTGNLDEVGIQAILDGHEKWETILKRQNFIVEEIEKQQKLTPELKEKILQTFKLELLEDLYLPYKQKRKTKATLAKEAGLEPLALFCWDLAHHLATPDASKSLEDYASSYINEEKKILNAQAALDGAQDILTEKLAEDQELRAFTRQFLFEKGGLKTSKGAKAKTPSKFENYFDFFEPISQLLKPESSHRYLAMRRGWMEEELTLSIGGKPDESSLDSGFQETLLQHFEHAACSAPNALSAPLLKKAARLALKGHVFPSLENEAHKALKEIADEAAIKVFSENVRKLLLSSPFGPKAVLGVDPGIRTGCKIAVIDDSGKYLANTVMHLQSMREQEEAKVLLKQLLEKVGLKAIAVGNGTAGRETESFIRQTLKEIGFSQVPVVMVNESGASVYSASEAAREEFPDLDVTVRGAISIARRLQDPLAELVKIDPKSIGVGQYQHDVAQNLLKKSLDQVVDSCVNQVGVNLNTASYHLLSHVAGIGPALAKAIVEHRSEKGLFKSRQELLEVSRFSKKAFEQAAGFLRIPEATHPLDNTGIHPERYELLEKLALTLGKSVTDLMGIGVNLVKKNQSFKEKVGQFTYEDIVKELEKPGRDPREHFTAFQYREDIHEVKDLQPGMICPGIVTNVTNFGAFVDIGVHQDGLIHVSQLADQFVKDPRDVVSPGDHVQVKVLEVNLAKNQIALTRRLEEVRSSNKGEKTSPGAFGKTSSVAQTPRKEFQKQKDSRPPQKNFSNNAFGALAGLKDLKR